MAMVCKICSHPERAAIDRAIVEQRSLRDIASQYGISRSSVDRHKSHIPKALANAKKAETVAESNSLLSRVENWISRCERLFDRAEAAGEWSGAASAAREVRSNLELLGKLNGELQTAGARVDITVANINLGALTPEQKEALYSRLKSEQFKHLSDEQLDAEIERLREETGRARRVFKRDGRTVVEGTRLMSSALAGSTARLNDSFAELIETWKQLTNSSFGWITTEALGPKAFIVVEFDLKNASYPSVQVLGSGVPETPSKALPQVIEGKRGD